MLQIGINGAVMVSTGEASGAVHCRSRRHEAGQQHRERKQWCRGKLKQAQSWVMAIGKVCTIAVLPFLFCERWGMVGCWARHRLDCTGSSPNMLQSCVWHAKDCDSEADL